MKKHLALFFSLVLLVVSVTRLTSAQAPQTGSLTGIVVDEAQATLPGVEVTISSPQLIVPEMSAVTNEHGFFRFSYLPPGRYRVAAKLSGFAAYVISEVRISVGLTTDLKIRMKQAAIQETVEVVGAAPAAALENTRLSLLVEKKDLENLPVQRNLSSVMALADGVTSDDAAMGAHQRSNAFNVDGVYLNDVRRGTQEVQGTLDSYDEVIIETAGHPAEFGQTTGAMLNVITKSGGNQFSGSLSGFYTGTGLQGTNYQGKGLSAPLYRKVLDLESTFTLGGPILKDKVWFFGSFSFMPKADRYESVLTKDVTQKSYLPSLKISAQLNNQHRLSFNLTTNSIRSPLAGAGIQEGGVVITQDASVKWTIDNYVGLLSWLWQSTKNSFLEIKGALSHSNDNIEANSHAPLIMDLATLEISNGMSSYFNTKKRYIGSAHYTQFVDFAGSHELKTGVEAEQTEMTARSVWYPDSAGMTSYYLIGGAPMMSVAVDPADGNPRLSSYTQLSYYLQDAWRLNSHFHFNLGVRISYLRSRLPKQNYIDQTLVLTKWTDFEPRLGLGYDPFGDGRTALRVGYNRYTAGTYMWFDSLNPNNSSENYYLWFGGTDFSYLFTYEPGLGGVGSQFSPNLRRPVTDEFLVSLSRAISNNFSADINFVYRKFSRFITTENSWPASAWVPVTIDNPLGGTMTVYDRQPDLPPATTILTNNPLAFRNYTAVIFSLQKRFSGGSSIRASYTWSRAYGRAIMGGTGALTAQPETGAAWNDPNVLINSVGLLDLNRTHDIKVQGILMLPYAFYISGAYDGASGVPYQRDFATSLPVSGAVTFFAEPRGSQHYPFLHLFSLRLGKQIQIRRANLNLFVDIFNPVNLDATTMTLNRFGSVEMGKVLGIQAPRYALVGARFTF